MFQLLQLTFLETLNTWAETDFNPAELDLFGMNKRIMSNAVIKCLKYMNDISKSNLTINADGVLSRREVDTPVDWIGENSPCISSTEIKNFLLIFFRCLSSKRGVV